VSTKSPSFNAHTVDATVGTAETTIAHTLGRAPLDGFIINRSGSGNVFRGATAWTSTNIYLTASASVTVTLLLF
jgi:hypothetical protein